MASPASFPHPGIDVSDTNLFREIAVRTAPLKPTQLDPVKLQKMLDATEDESKDDDLNKELRAKLARAKLAPQEKSRWPMTASQTVGWMWKDGMDEYKADLKWKSSMKTCEEVRYAQSYVMMSGKSPYAGK